MAAETVEQAIRTGEWFVIVATLLGPILAVQAQKWVERSNAHRHAKEGIFRTLMATRDARVSVEHVKALNMIDIAFYGRKYFGQQVQSPADKAVCRAWGEYLDCLNVPNAGMTQDQDNRLLTMRFEKFIALLAAIATSLDYDFSLVALRNGWYAPAQHGMDAAQNVAVRNGIARLVAGEGVLKMEIVNMPTPQQQTQP